MRYYQKQSRRITSNSKTQPNSPRETSQRFIAWEKHQSVAEDSDAGSFFGSQEGLSHALHRDAKVEAYAGELFEEDFGEAALR